MDTLNKILIGLFTGYSIYLILYKFNIINPSGLILLSAIGLMILIQYSKESMSIMKFLLNVSAAIQLYAIVSLLVNTLWANDLLSVEDKIAYDDYGTVGGFLIFGILAFLSCGENKKNAFLNCLWWSSITVAVAFTTHLPFHHEVGGDTAFILFPLLVIISYIVLTDRQRTNKLLYAGISLLLFYAMIFAILNVDFFQDMKLISMYISIAVINFLIALVLKREDYVIPEPVRNESNSGYSYRPRTYRPSYETNPSSNDGYGYEENNEEEEESSFPPRNYKNDYNPVPSFFENDKKEEEWKPNFNGMKNYTNERDLDIEFRHQPDFVREKAIFEREKELPAHLRTDFKGRSEDDDD